ncbi:uncharacterized protein METZ01_LOCUS294637, partial [marine metagenome]
RGKLTGSMKKACGKRRRGCRSNFRACS